MPIFNSDAKSSDKSTYAEETNTVSVKSKIKAFGKQTKESFKDKKTKIKDIFKKDNNVSLKEKMEALSNTMKEKKRPDSADPLRYNLNDSKKFNNISQDEFGATQLRDFKDPDRTGVVDLNTNIFRYGLWDNKNAYEDPIHLGFTLEIDTNERESPLFNHCGLFIDTYAQYNKELNQRKVIYRKFIELVTQFFKSQESGSDYVKSHYIESISGLKTLLKPFAGTNDDFLTIIMHEDVGMAATHLATLYNNLIWSYNAGKEMIPKNLLRFKLHIKISEIRNITSIRLAFKDSNSVNKNLLNLIRSNVTCQIYTLHNCYFDFMDSSAFKDELTIGGFGASLPDKSSLEFKIFFDSVSRFTRPALQDNTWSIDDRNWHLGMDVGSELEHNIGNVSYTIFEDKFNLFNIANIGLYKPDITGEFKPDPVGNASTSKEQSPSKEKEAGFFDDLKRKAVNSFEDRVKGYVDNRWKELKNRVKDEIDKKRAELISRLLLQVKEKIGIRPINPHNVYQGMSTLDAFAQNLKSDIGLDILGNASKKANKLGADITKALLG